MVERKGEIMKKDQEKYWENSYERFKKIVFNEIISLNLTVYEFKIFLKWLTEDIEKKSVIKSD